MQIYYYNSTCILGTFLILYYLNLYLHMNILIVAINTTLPIVIPCGLFTFCDIILECTYQK